ncbi:MAG: helix-turn-helix transcriptional regulator [Burkholderiales bacterium]|nr:helix-turn-helix transcriptional regulator [Burkholderiales bacterium]
MVMQTESGSAGWRDAAPEFRGTGSAASLPLAALFNELAFGVAIIDRDGGVVHVSRAARLMMQAGRGLRLAEGRVIAEDAASGAALARGVTGAIEGRRSYLAFGQGDGRMDVAVVPLAGAQFAEPLAALIFERASGSNGLALYFFAQAYRLTRTEHAVLGELGEGLSVVEAARALDSSVHTLRTHVRNILAKTGVPNLRGLVRRIGMLPPVGARFAVAHARAEGLVHRPAASTAAVPAPRSDASAAAREDRRAVAA